LGQTMAQGLAGAQKSAAGAATPGVATPAAAGAGAAGAGASEAAGNTSDPEARLGQLKNLLDKGLISAGDFETAKAEVIKRLVG
jgi:membrane protease subunit (stomatin/prohibitin family)